MSRSLTLATCLVAALALLAGACTPGEPEFDEQDQARAGDRAEEPAEDNGENGEAPVGEILPVTAIDIDFEQDTLSAPAGPITIELTNEGRIHHDFAIRELGDQIIVEADPGETNRGNVTLDPGTYNYFCTVPGHEAAGMEGVLTAS